MTWYALATYLDDGGERRAAVVLDGGLYDLARAQRVLLPGREAPPSWVHRGLDFSSESWAELAPWLDTLADLVARRAAEVGLAPVPLGLERLAAPIRPARIFAAASNYVEHADEMGTVLAAKAESKPYVFIKASTSVIGDGDAVVIPIESKKVDWEVELGVVIGRGGRRIARENALAHVAGYTIVNDVSARDLTRREDFPFKFDWFQGKSFDTFAPLGPWIVPRSRVADPQKLRLSLTVNGVTMQDATTAEMIFDVSEQIAYLSSLLTLEPGDVIATGTPTGVGMGRGVFLKPGDVMVASIEGIGKLTSPVEAEAPEPGEGR